MPKEYVLQKRTLAHWSYVTWYDDLEQAKRNLKTISQDSGYSWRLVELNVIEEKLLDGELKDEPDEDIVEAPNTIPRPAHGWEATGGWPKPNHQANWGSPPAVAPTHGLVGSVWLGNPTTKEKKRVPAAEAATMLANGWIKSGPRTVL